MAILMDLKVGDRLEIQLRENYEDNQHAIVSQVIDINEDRIIILNPIKQGMSYPLVVGQRIKIIFYREERGIYRFLAEIKRKIQKSMIIYEIIPLGDAEKIQRRYYYRLDIIRKVIITIKDQKMEIEGNTKDISGGGMKVTTKGPIPIGSKVSCTLSLKDDETVVVSGQVVRCYKEPDLNEYFIGISFKDISAVTESKIIAFIFERQRLLRKKGLI